MYQSCNFVLLSKESEKEVLDKLDKMDKVQVKFTHYYKGQLLRSFGKRIVDAAPCIKESKNQYYSCAAPRQYYDKNTLVYLKLEQIENENK